MESLDSTPKTRLETTGSGLGNRSQDLVACSNPAKFARTYESFVGMIGNRGSEETRQRDCL